MTMKKKNGFTKRKILSMKNNYINVINIIDSHFGLTTLKKFKKQKKYLLIHCNNIYGILYTLKHFKYKKCVIHYHINLNKFSKIEINEINKLINFLGRSKVVIRVDKLKPTSANMTRINKLKRNLFLLPRIKIDFDSDKKYIKLQKVSFLNKLQTTKKWYSVEVCCKNNLKKYNSSCISLIETFLFNVKPIKNNSKCQCLGNRKDLQNV